MARAASSDFFQGFRYHLEAMAGASGTTDMLNLARGAQGSQAGFQSVTIPELSQDVVEYREGNSMWTIKQAGIPTVSDMTLMRGVTLSDTRFFDWVMATINGTEYRADITIHHYARQEMKSGTTQGESPFAAARKLICHECLPTRVKPMGDLDATASEVSLAELDVAVEHFDFDIDAPVVAGP